VGFDLHERPLFEPQPLLALDDWPPCPLELDLHKKPFRSLDAWQTIVCFKEFVKEKLDSYIVEGNGMIKFKDKLKMLKMDLKSWNREVFRCMDNTKQVVLGRLRIWTLSIITTTK